VSTFPRPNVSDLMLSELRRMFRATSMMMDHWILSMGWFLQDLPRLVCNSGPKYCNFPIASSCQRARITLSPHRPCAILHLTPYRFIVFLVVQSKA
jgi:hypothetical protein